MEDYRIEDGDYVIHDYPGGYRVDQINEVFEDFDDAIEAVREDMDWKQWWPNVWFVNDHGNVDLLGLTAEGYETVQSWV